MKSPQELSFRIRPKPPFRLDLTAWTLRRRRENIVDRWNGSVYRRVLVLDDRPVEVRVSQTGPPENPSIRAAARGRFSASSRTLLISALERMLGLRVDLLEFYPFASTHRLLAGLAHRFRGVKPPRFPSIFEAVANGIACQQLSLTVGIILLNRLAEKYGAPLKTPEGTSYSFALPHKLARARMSGLRSLGFSAQKSRALIELARKAASEGADLGGLYGMNTEAALERLSELRGVGRWTAEYALLRGLGRLDIFPGDDVGARNKLQRLLHMDNLDYEGVARIMKIWRPYAGLIYFHLLLDGLSAAGYLEN